LAKCAWQRARSFEPDANAIEPLPLQDPMIDPVSARAELMVAPVNAKAVARTPAVKMREVRERMLRTIVELLEAGLSYCDGTIASIVAHWDVSVASMSVNLPAR
jgi:hypothetical protein